MFRNSTDMDAALGMFPAAPGAAADLDPFSTVSLGPLLGQGGSGHVYRGTWNGATVAVKVCNFNSAFAVQDNASCNFSDYQVDVMTEAMLTHQYT